MAKKGVSKIEGPSTIKLGEEVVYSISRVHRKEDIAKGKYAQWILYVEESGKWKELKRHPNLPPKIGDTTTLVITNQNLVGKRLLLEAYMYSPEKTAPPGIIIKVEKGGKKKIEDIQLLMADEKTPITKKTVMRYGQSIIVKVQSVNMQKEKVTIYLYEDDEKGKGHSVKNEKNLVDQVEKIFDDNGLITHTFKLPIDFSKIANAYLDGENDRHHEYYIHIKSEGLSQTSVNFEVLNPEYIEQEGKIEGVILIGKAKGIGTDPILDTGKSVSVVKDNKIEELIDAYFARKEYTIPTDIESYTYEYTFRNNNVNIDKDKIAKIIKNNIDKQLVKVKKYCKLESIKKALTKDSYQKGEQISIRTYLLDAEFRRIDSAQLSEKIYLVVKASGLNDCNASITVKEKDGIINEKESSVPLLEISEEKMDETIEHKDISGIEKTEFSGVIKDNILSIPIQLRPKSDTELQQWKSKLQKGKKDGDCFYKFGNETTINDGSKRKQIANIILNNINKGNDVNTPLDKNRKVYVEDIEKVLVINSTYKKEETIPIPTYREEKEHLYLQVKVQGKVSNHEKEFLKQEGKYLKIGGNKPIIFPLLVKPENDINKKWGDNFYWGDSIGKNQATFNSNRSKGKRKHAGRDLYTLPNAVVVAMADGIVLQTKHFYAGTDHIVIHHKTNDGREFIINYGEVDPNTKKVKKGDIVIQGQELGVTGYLKGITVIKGHIIYMLHFEYYTGRLGFDIDRNPILGGNNVYIRRDDIEDPIAILNEAYKNTFDSTTYKDHLFSEEDAKNAIKQLYKQYKDSEWHWEWEGVKRNVKGIELVTIIEKMYRLETAHFKSKQYQNCGTGGMEVFGKAPYYGWDSSLFTEPPIGSWSAFEGKGLSEKGGNEQVTDRKKEFVKLSSVLVGMEYKAKYIIKYNGNYERWYNKNNTSHQLQYRNSLKNIKARFIEKIKENDK